MSVYINDVEITTEQCKALLSEFSVVPEVESYILRSKRWKRDNQGRWAHPHSAIPYEVNVKRSANSEFAEKMEALGIAVPSNFTLKWAYQKEARRNGEKGFTYYPNVETGGIADDVYQKNVFVSSYGKRRSENQSIGGVMLTYEEDYDLLLFDILSPHCKSSPFASRAPRYELVITSAEKEAAYAKAMGKGNNKMALAIAMINLVIPELCEISDLKTFLLGFKDNHDYQKLLETNDPEKIKSACYDFVISKPENYQVFIDKIAAIKAEISGAYKTDSQGGHVVDISAYVQNALDKGIVRYDKDLGAIVWGVSYSNDFKKAVFGRVFLSVEGDDPSIAELHELLLNKFKESESKWAKWLNLVIKQSASGLTEKIRALFDEKILRLRFDADKSNKPFLDFYNVETDEILEPLLKGALNVPADFKFDTESMVTVLHEKLQTVGGRKALKMVEFYFDKIKQLEKATE